MSDILDIKEASSFTGLSEGTLRRYANNGKVQAIRKGTRYFFTKEELKKLLSPMALETLEQAEKEEANKAAATYDLPRLSDETLQALDALKAKQDFEDAIQGMKILAVAKQVGAIARQAGIRFAPTDKEVQQPDPLAV